MLLLSALSRTVYIRLLAINVNKPTSAALSELYTTGLRSTYKNSLIGIQAFTVGNCGNNTMDAINGSYAIKYINYQHEFCRLASRVA